MTRTLTRWTAKDYHHMIETGVLAGRQVELIDGKIVDMAPELPIHRATYRRGVQYLESLLKARAVIFSAAPISLPTDGEPQPDISIVKPPESKYNKRHPSPSDVYWLIEVSNSTLTYDLGEKATAYARDGIPDYWVIDIKHKQVWVHRAPQKEGYASVKQVSSGTVAPLEMPGIEVDVARLFV